MPMPLNIPESAAKIVPASSPSASRTCAADTAALELLSEAAASKSSSTKVQPLLDGSHVRLDAVLYDNTADYT